MGQFIDPPVLPGFPFPNSSQSQSPAGNYTYEGPTINGIAMPGQWLLTKAARTFGWQQQKGAFLTGAVAVPTGDPLMEITYEIRFFESGSISAFIQICQTLLKKPAFSINGPIPTAAALGIDDAILKILGCSKVVVTEVDFPKTPLVSSGGKGAWVGHVSFLEYRPPRPAGPIPNQDIPDPGALAPSAATNLATANASVTAGAGNLQSTAAQALVPPR
jgi:hypothetical protein